MSKVQQDKTEQTPAQEKAAAFVVGEGVSLTASERGGVQTALSTLRSGDYTAADAATFGSKHAHYVHAGRKASSLRRIYGAVAFHVALTAGVIGDGEGQEDQQTWGKRYGMSKANVSALRSLGRALSVGYGPEYATWSKASAKAGNASVAKALREGNDGADIDVKVARALDVTAPRKTADEKAADAEPTTETAAEPTPERDPFEVAVAAVAFLDDFLKAQTGTPEGDALMGKIVAIVKREQTLAQKRRADAAKVA